MFLILPILVSSDNPDIVRELTRVRRVLNTNMENMCAESISRIVNNTITRLNSISVFDVSLVEKRLNITSPVMMIHISLIPPISCVGRPRKLRQVVETLNRLILKLNFMLFTEIERNERLNAIYRMLSV